ncbi:diguanylate cyclase [Actinopolymorpha pittospori]
MVAHSGHHVRSWGLWSLPAPALTFFLLVDAAAVTYALTILATSPRVADLSTAVTLCACAVVCIEGARRVERRRRRGGALHKDLQPVWMIAAAIVLPPTTALLCVILLRTWWRVRASRCIPHRWTFSTAVVVIAAGIAHSTYDAVAGVLGDAGWAQHQVVTVATMLAGIAFLATDALLCAVAIRLLAPTSTLREMFGDSADLAVDAVTGGLGCLVAAASMVTPWAGVLGIPITLAGQRALLLAQLESEASTDGKTELSNFPHWRQEVEDLLDRARRRESRFAILLADIDHFKRINDTHGHLAGDHVLREVAARMRAVIRTEDVAGRFGGEEFVIGMPGIDVADAVGAAHRLRTAISGSLLPIRPAEAGTDGAEVVRLTISVGVAVYPSDGTTLDQLLDHADRALYAAKAAGRNRVSRGQGIEPDAVPLAQPTDLDAPGQRRATVP